ncbi:hypothetical protein CERZMDRAFT_92585 [Cercospora zeae-maydis SCOH1-5]|uniref:Uncharacterized protein n=1 Tax=Cercospora zeae-maydis SCOH1-5 TaxID=717836 RepID=A0A6A6FX89_9PEZI|nr:hypothetical protein CERZMDRAFT_92585 [Cercospora zeae-maydis SCOH1-5]
MLALIPDYASFPTGFVSCYDFDTPYLRTREAPGIFHTMFGHEYCNEAFTGDDGILVMYRCTEAEEYFVYVPISMEVPVRALRFSKLVFDHGRFIFTVSWMERFGERNGAILTTQSFQGHEDYTRYMFSHLQTCYTMEYATPAGPTPSTSKRDIENEEATTTTTTRITVNWKHWAQINGKTQALPPKKRDWKAWLPRKRRKESEKTSKKMGRADVEDLDLDCKLHSFLYHHWFRVHICAANCMQIMMMIKVPGPMTKIPDSRVEEFEVINRHGHIRDGYQADLQLHLQRLYILKYGNYIAAQN